jgi:hypothetical protein
MAGPVSLARRFRGARTRPAEYQCSAGRPRLITSWRNSGSECSQRNSATNTWTEEAALLVGKSEPAAALLGSSIIANDGYSTSGDTGDNESYTVSTNTWKSLTADPNPRNASCYGAVSGQVYIAGGLNNSGPPTTSTVNESFNANSNKWTTLAAMPTASVWQASAVGNGMLYCIGGQASFQGAVVSNMRIYQP